MSVKKEGDLGCHPNRLNVKAVSGKTLLTGVDFKGNGRFHKYLTLFIILLLFLAACGGGEAEPDPPAETETTTTETEAAEANEALDAEEMAEEEMESAFPLTLTHDFGEVTFEQTPERIVALSLTVLEMAVALDVPVVAVGFTGLPPAEDGGVPTLPHLDKPILGDPVYLEPGPPSQEVILGLNPDLIVMDALGIEPGTENPNHDAMSAVAPTMSYSSSISEPRAWIAVFRDFARLMGKSEQAEEIIAEYEANATALIESVAPILETSPEITMIYGSPDNVGMISNEFAIGGLIDTLGFTLVVPDGVEFDPGGIVNISPEILNQIDADTIMMWKFNPEAPILGEELLATLDIPVTTLFPQTGVGFTGPNSEIFYMTAVAEALQTLYADVAVATEETAADTRLLTDFNGDEVEVPADPQRVVVLTELDLDSAMAVGLKPIGSVDGRGQSTLPSYLLDQLDGVTSIGSIAEPNPEAIAVLDPDLILVGSPIPPVQALLPDLSEVAPVIVTFPPGSDWKTALDGVADALNRSNEAAAFLADYDARVAELAAAKPADLNEATIVRWRADGMVIMLPNAFSSQVLAEVGIGRPHAHADLTGFHPVHTDIISQEQWELLNYDALFGGGLGPDGAALYEETLQDPLMQALDVVAAGHVVVGDGLVWGSVGGPFAAHAVLDDVEAMYATFEGMAADTADLITNVNIEGFPKYAPAVPLLPSYERNGDTILVTHAYGEAEIPADPQRIFVNDLATMQILLSLDIAPVGVASFFPELTGALAEVSQDVELLVDLTGEGVNPEELLNLDPDLILGHAQFAPGQITEEQFAIFNEIAPTVVFTGNPFFYWKEATVELAELFEVPERATAVLTDYNSQIANLRAEAQEKVGDDSITVLLLFDITFWLYSAGGLIDEENYVPLSVTTWAYRELGLTPAPEVAGLAGDQYWAEISLEIVPELKADRLVVWPNAYGGAEIGSGLDDYVDSPIWEAVPAVANDQVSLMQADNAVEGYWTTPHLIREFLDTLD
ncbi:MAG: ABC transporter substrate-binding protein [Chloroflexota bacterium]